MKKSLLRFMLLVTGLLLGVNGVWAYTPTLSAEYAVTGYKYKAFYDISNTNVDGMCPTEGDLRFRGSGYGLYNFGSGNRGADVTISLAKDDLLFVEFKDSQGRNVTVNSISSCTANATYTSGDIKAFDVTEAVTSVNVNLGRAGCIIAILVMEKDNSAATADYTINYKFGEEIVKKTTGSVAVGSTINTDASFFVGEVKYFRADGQPESLTVAAEGSTLDVIVRKAETWNYSITSSLGGTIFSGTGLEGETVYAPYPRYQLSGTTLYEAAVTNKEYRKPFTMTADNLTAEITYTSKEENVVFYTEGEKINDATVVTYGNIPVRASGAQAATVANDAALTLLPFGKYKIFVGAFTSKSKDWSNYAAKIGVGAEIFTATLSAANLNEITSEEYTLNNFTEIKYLADGSTTDCSLDYIYIVKTGDVEPAPTPILTFTAPTESNVSLTFGVYDTEDTYGVDFGDGTLQIAKVGVNNSGPVDPESGQTTAATVFTGTVAGDGTIKVYGKNDVWYLISSGAMPTALDQAKLMNVQQMTITGANVESVELPAYSQMTQFNFNNSPVKTLDVSKVTTLTSLSVDNTTQSLYAPQLESIDLSANTELTYLKIIGNATNKGKLAAIDLSNNTKLANVYLQDNVLKTVTLPAEVTLTFLNLQNNELEALDLSALTSITNAWLENNQLKTLSLGNVTKVCKFENNALTLATLPAQPSGMNTKTKTKNFTYAPQAAIEVPAMVKVLDLSAQATVAKGELNPSAVGDDDAYTTWLSGNTIFAVKTVGETPATLVEGTDYSIADGVITFLNTPTDKVYVEMTNEAFPKFTGANVLKTTEFTVAPASLFTLKGEAGKSATVTMGVYDAFDIYGVDFGDGVIVTDSVGWHNGGVRDAEGYDPTDPSAVPSAKEGTTHNGATQFSGTVGESGIITVYGTSATWLLDCQDGVVPTDYSQAGLANLHEFKLSGTADESIALPEWSQLTLFSLSNSKTKSLDVSKVTALTSLSVVNTSMAENDMMLESIDLSKNTALENLTLGGTFYKAGVLKTIDLSKNTALKMIIVANQQLESIVLPEGAELSSGLNVAMNKLTALDLSKLGSVKTLNAYTNQIESLDLSKLTEGSDLYIKENKLTELNVPVSVGNLEAQSNQLTSATIANATKSCKLENNAFTLAALPAQPAGLSSSSKTKKFTYAPQAALQVADPFLVNDELDLSAQATVAKGELGKDGSYTTWYENEPTVFTVKTAGETPATLVEGTDYNIEGGKITFLKAQADKVYVEMTNEAFPKFTGANAFKTTEFAVMVLEDITIDATDIAEGDITTAIATKTAGKLVKNITINLAAETVYTVSATIEVPAGLTINGNGATIDGSALTTPMIQMSATPTVAQNEKEAYLSDGIIVKDVTVTGLKYQFIYGNKVKALLAKVEVENSVIGIDGTNKKTVFDFNGGGNASEILINNSTIYANPSNEQNGGLFSSQSGHGSIQDLGSEKQLFAITNSTIYNIAYGKTTNSQRRNNTAGMEFQVENSIIVNSGKNGQFIVGLNGGSANAAQTYTASNNVFNFDGADVSANEQAKVQEKIATFEMTSIVGVVTFTDAANGNFAGNVELPFGATEPTTKPGDPRWTLIFKQATGIQSVKAVDLNDAVIYNLNGARVSKPGKGLYIINGNKVVIK